ncbi:MAG: hypothetical protein KIT68_03035 [Phycisphaeraceae bacterium]|nr:hypothetical protein [Phycisphaeraceae bacterium]
MNSGSAGGGGRSGAGGASLVGAPGGGCYGDGCAPTAMGSGGGRDTDCCGYRTPGRGGGVIKLVCAGPMTVLGEILVNGGDAPVGESGGGAGGSLWIVAQSLSGDGVISADGGAGSPGQGGGGGGGRIAVYLSGPSSFAGSLRSVGGPGFVRGGAGTVYVKQGAARGTVTISNGGNAGETTELNGPNDWDANLVVRGLAVLGHARQAEGTELRLTGDAHVQADGFIAMTGRGWPTSVGPGAGANSGGAAGGAGHGGAGGRSSVNAPGGGTYGDVLSPTTLGSGGGRDTDCCGFRTAGSGGGALRLTVDGVLTVDGELSVRGGNATQESGGGSGGSLLIRAGAVAGVGVISAAGGNGWTTFGGGGGGGRIAVYACSITMPLANIQAPGGAGFQAGSAGTVYFGSSSIVFTQHPVVQTLRVGQSASFTVGATTSQNPPTLAYQWRKQNSGGAFVNLVEGQSGGRYTGVASPTLTITDLACPDTGRYDCIVTDACGSAPSRAGGLSVKNPADIATEGSSDPNTGPDGFITGADFDTFVLVFFTEFRNTQGVLLGDLTDDSGYGDPDGFLTGADFDRFILLFFQGCPL